MFLIIIKCFLDKNRNEALYLCLGDAQQYSPAGVCWLPGTSNQHPRGFHGKQI